MRALIVAVLICASSAAWAETGEASHYGYHDGQTTRVACPGHGRLQTTVALTAAHKTLRCGTRVRVTNRLNGRSVEVVITDRGPYKRGRIIDVTYRAAKELGMAERGHAPVVVTILSEPQPSHRTLHRAHSPSVAYASAGS